jgi:hypothetical protein
MTESTIYKTDDAARPIGATPAPEKRKKSLVPPFRPLVVPPVKRRGPVIAGGIIRLDLSANEER